MIFWLIAVVLILYLCFEKHRLSKARTRIPIRIHVYGTRGKTTTTYSLFKALQKTGKNVFAKTTGDTPQTFLPDGSSHTLKRFAPARIHEYLTCLYKACKLDCEIVIFECMALAPESIVMARDILKPTHTIITNTRPDHYESMGKTPEAIAKTLALSIGSHQTVFALLDEASYIIKDAADRYKNPFYGIDYDKDSPPLEQTQRIVNTVLSQLGVTTQAITPSHWLSFKSYRLEDIGEVFFLDLFSTNDVYSSELLLSHALQHLAETHQHIPTTSVIGLLATRADRPLRTHTFIKWIHQTPLVTHYIPVGWHQYFAYLDHKKQLKPHSMNPFPAPLMLLRHLKKTTQTPLIIVGLGNLHGFGERFRDFLEKGS